MTRLLAVLCGCVIVITSFTPKAQGEQDRFANLKAVPFTQVQIRDSFWAPRRETNRKVSIPHSLDMLENAGNVHNFELAAAGARSGYSGPLFMDSDLYKGLEAASYTLATDPDPALEKRIDDIIAKIAAAQLPDGYINTHFQVNAPDKRWTNLRDAHELYCAGHMFEAAVAHFQATGKRTFLDVAVKFADYIDSVFGDGPGKRMGYPGHPEIELALIKLWRVTGEQRYFDLARFFVENRGRKFYAQEHRIPMDKYDGSYWQDDVPIIEHKNIKGHAVRAAYLLSGAVDVAAQTTDEGLLNMLNKVWRNTTQKRMYVTGGIGPSARNEGFTVDYDLPNLTAYQETCASVAMILWNHRLNLLYGDSKYADIVERALYNGFLAGVSLDGKLFFYVNPLESHGTHHRSGWFGCACCPPNVTRTLASLGGYAYAVSDEAIWINLYVQGSAKTAMRGQELTLDVVTDYPWDGKVNIKPQLSAPTQFEMRLRVPDWCDSAIVAINGNRVANPRIDRGYLVLGREWRAGDAVELNLPMPARQIAASPLVKEDIGQLAIQRGPIIYCLEACDQDTPINAIALTAGAKLKPEKRPELLGGVVVLTGTGNIAADQEWSGKLYQPDQPDRRVQIMAVPYCVWDNRESGPMKVWLPVVPPPPVVGGPETKAKVSISFQNWNCQPNGINDGIEPKNSSEQSAAQCHWWPHKGSDEWAQYIWKKLVNIGAVRVYWFNDTRRGGNCHLPVSWQILYRDGDNWKPVKAESDYLVAEDKWCQVAFEPVSTTALRLAVKLQSQWSAGVHEWQVLE